MKNLLNLKTFLIIKNLDFINELNINENDSLYLINLLLSNILAYIIIACFIWLVLYLYFNLLPRDLRKWLKNYLFM